MLDCVTKMKLFKAYCCSFYGCELWDLANIAVRPWAGLGWVGSGRVRFSDNFYILAELGQNFVKLAQKSDRSASHLHCYFEN